MFRLDLCSSCLSSWLCPECSARAEQESLSSLSFLCTSFAGISSCFQRPICRRPLLRSTHLLPPPPQPTQACRLRAPTTYTIPLLPSTSARTYTQIHTSVVLSYLLLQFKALVADPMSTMIFDFGVLYVMPGAFCAVCLPKNGSWASTVSPADWMPKAAEKGEKMGKSRGTAMGSTTGLSSKQSRPAEDQEHHLA
jgi:hypothetical protein